MTTNKIVTLFHFFESSEEYIKVFSGNASVYCYHRITTDDNGVKNNNTIKIRIPGTKFINVSNGDYICIGFASELIKEKCHKVIGVSDNRRGMNPHIRIEVV